jgi:hypothetical protein
MVTVNCSIHFCIEKNKYYDVITAKVQELEALVAGVLTDLGCVYNNNVTNKTDYLIIGEDSNPCWAYSCYCRKVEKAMSMQKNFFINACEKEQAHPDFVHSDNACCLLLYIRHRPQFLTSAGER